MSVIITEKEIYSDAGKYLHRIGSNAYFSRCTKSSSDTAEMFEEVDEIPEYVDELQPDLQSQVLTLARVQARTMSASITDAEALQMQDLFPQWEEFISREVKKDEILKYAGVLWRVVQAHTVQSIYPPSLSTASLYNRIEKEHAGTADDPIPYAPPMEIHGGKWYVQDGVKYRCTRDSGQALSHDLPELVGLYVELA